MIGERLYCCITNKYLSEVDNIVSFPLIGEPPDIRDPITLCSEGIALRSAFDKCEWKDVAIERAKRLWLETAHAKAQNAYLTILEENDNYLILRLQPQERIKVHFLEHIFTLDAPAQYWMPLCSTEITKDLKQQLILHPPKLEFVFRHTGNYFEITKKWRNVNNQLPFEQISITESEFEKLRIILCQELAP